MEKLIRQHRKQLGDFEVIDIVDEAEVDRLRERVEVDVPVELHWTWNYGSEVAELRTLYEKGKGGQWNAQTDVDWSIPCTPDDWVMNPEASLLAQVAGMMGADEATRKAAAFGVLMMRRIVREASPAQRDELEDWAFGILEALNANQQLDMLHCLGPKYGIDAEGVTQAFVAMPEFAELNSRPYMHTVVPNLRNLGLITERTRERWKAVGMMVESAAGVKGVPAAG